VAEGPWHTEARVQAAVVRTLQANGWQIVSQADTATKEHGIDVVASRGRQTAGIEVKPRSTDELGDTGASGLSG